MTYPHRHIPSVGWPPKALSDHPTNDTEPQRIFFPQFQRSPLALPLPPRIFRGRDGDAFLSTVAFCRSSTARNDILVRYMSLPQSELMRDAILLSRAELASQETVTTQRNPPDVQRRI